MFSKSAAQKNNGHLKILMRGVCSLLPFCYVMLAMQGMMRISNGTG
jgi:hypothetical protein